MSHNADPKTIKAAYRTLMFKCRAHPDLGGNENIASLINEAYEVLSNPVARRNYDLTLGPEVFDPKKQFADFTEKRRIPRVKVNLTASYKSSEKDFKDARILDLSALGCRLQTSEKIGDSEKVTINITGHIIKGTVRWKRMFHPSIFQRVYESGIEFEKEFEDIDTLNSY